MLDIFIEKKFLEDFFLLYNENKASKAENIVFQILTEFTETRWFIDVEAVESHEKLEELKLSNYLLGEKIASSIPHIPVQSIKEFLNKKHQFENTTLVFTQKTMNWFEEVENRGAICFSLENYEEKINDIVRNYHYKIDLSGEGFKWEKLRVLHNINQVLLNDNYILVDKGDQKLDHNLMPLLKQLIPDFDREMAIEIYSKEFNVKSGMPEEIKKLVSEKLQKLNRVFANYKTKFKIINNSLSNTEINFHDRMIITNFQTIDSGAGFNLFSGKNKWNKNINSQIISETIFEPYTYKRIKNLKRAHKKYFDKISGERYPTLKFTHL